METNKNFELDLTTQIVTAAIAANRIQMADVVSTFREVFQAIDGCHQQAFAPVAPPAQEPAVNPKKSVHDEYLICLEDGKKFKSLKRHLSTHYGLTPDQYRTKWGLPSNYPMVAPAYAAARSQLAKQMWLGRKPGSLAKAA